VRAWYWSKTISTPFRLTQNVLQRHIKSDWALEVVNEESDWNSHVVNYCVQRCDNRLSASVQRLFYFLRKAMYTILCCIVCGQGLNKLGLTKTWKCVFILTDWAHGTHHGCRTMISDGVPEIRLQIILYLLQETGKLDSDRFKRIKPFVRVRTHI